MLWLCLRLPLLPLEALDLPVGGPATAVLEQDKVLLADTAAQQRGIRAGMSVQTARSLCASLRCLPRNPDQEQRLLQHIAMWSYRFSGSVSLSPPNAIVLELAASLRLFRNLARLYRRFINAFRRRQLTVYSAIADTPLAAELLSLSNPSLKNLVDGQGQLRMPALKQALAALPVTTLPLTATQIESLNQMGLHTLGQLQTLPLRALNRRLGPEIGKLLQKMRGEQADPRAIFTPNEEFHCQRQFDGGIERLEQLQFPITAMLGELKTYLKYRQCLPNALLWQIDYLDGGTQSWQLPLGLRHFDKRSVLQLVMLSLEKLKLAGPVEQLSLHCQHFVTQESPSNRLFDEQHIQRRDQLDQVLAKLRLRLESESIVQFTLQDAHLPEQCYALSTAEAKALMTPESNGEATSKTLRPNWLLDPPQSLYHRNGTLHWRGQLALLQGPERIDGLWWQQRHARDYYIARHEDGRLCWLYRDCLHNSWYLHGFFA